MKRLIAALILLAAGAAIPALADLNYTQGVGTVIFDFICQTTKHCSAHVPINSSGQEIFTSSAPAQVTGVNGSFPATQLGNWSVRSLGNGGAILDFPGQNASSPANAFLIGGQFNTSPTTITSGNSSPIQLDSSGNLKVNVIAGPGGGTSSTFGAAFPATGTALGVTDGANMQGLRIFNGQNQTTPGTVVQTGCQFNTSPTTITTGNSSPRQCDSVGNALVAANDGKIATIGALADAAWVSGSGSVIAIAKTIANNTAASVPAGSNNIGTFGTATGSAPPANAVYTGANASGASGGQLRGVINCDTSAFYDASTTGKTKIVTGVSGRKIYICGFLISTGGNATNVDMGSGTGTNCGSTYTKLTPAFQLAANDKVGANAEFWNGLVGANNADDWCVNASAANAVQVIVWYAIL